VRADNRMMGEVGGEVRDRRIKIGIERCVPAKRINERGSSKSEMECTSKAREKKKDVKRPKT